MGQREILDILPFYWVSPRWIAERLGVSVKAVNTSLAKLRKHSRVYPTFKFKPLDAVPNNFLPGRKQYLYRKGQ